MIIYGARYPKQKKNELENVFKKYESFKLLSNSKPEIPNNFPNFYKNETINQAIYSILFSLQNERNVIITGKEGNGKTQLAKWISEYWNNKNNEKENDDDIYFCVCTENLTCRDIIGGQYIKNLDGKEIGEELIEWKSGFLLNAIEKGKCCILDSLEEAPSTITERLNGLLDKKYNNEKQYFNLYENPKKKKIEIHENFRLIGTCEYKNINQMSPAFINRFDIIYLEDQLIEMEDSQIKEFISYLLNNTNIEDLIIRKKSQEDEMKDHSYQKNENDLINLSQIQLTEYSTYNTKNNYKDLIDLTFNKFKQRLNEKSKEISLMLELSQLCKSIKLYDLIFYNLILEKKITSEELVDLSYNILINISNFNE